MANTRKKRSAAQRPFHGAARPDHSKPPVRDTTTNATPTGGGKLTVHLLARCRAIIDESRELLVEGRHGVDNAWHESAQELIGHIVAIKPQLDDAIAALDDGELDSAAAGDEIGGAA